MVTKRLHIRKQTCSRKLKFKIFLGYFSSSMRWRWPNQRRRLYLITPSILEIPIRVLRSDIVIFSHNLTGQIHLTIVLSFLISQWMSSTLTAQILLAYSRTLRIQALYACPLTFSEMPLFVSTGSKLEILPGRSHSVCCCFKTATWLTDGIT